MYKFFNAHHSPVGSYSSFTLGHKGASGGFGNMLGKPADQDIYIGYGQNQNYKLLPFFDKENIISIDNFTEDKVFESSNAKVEIVDENSINRLFNVGTDEFKFDNFSFKIYTPHFSIPENEEDENYKLSIAPGLIAEVEINNETDQEQEIVFGLKRNNKSSTLWNSKVFPSIIDGLETAIATSDSNTKSVFHFTLQDCLNKNWQNNEMNSKFILGEVGLLITKVPPKTNLKVAYSLNFFVDSTITSGIRTKFKYLDYFNNIEEVGEYVLHNKDKIISESLKINKWLDNQSLNAEQKFQIAHAQKSYYGSTQLIKDSNNRVYHIVNEGEYQMMQTFDLMIDHLFYELEKNPWVVKNNLELFINRYSYYDSIKDIQGNIYDGGISFTHDMGNINHFTDKGFSSYELTDLSGCFSHMTYEQLTNFIITILTYYFKVDDKQFIKENSQIIDKCLESILMRDNPKEDLRNGMMSFDSSRVGIGSEITTYDSLDISLGQSRNNTYIASKTYASYCLLLDYYKEFINNENINIIEKQINRLIKTIHLASNEGLIPAVLENENKSMIIPISEGLVYLKYLNKEEYIDEKGKFGSYIKDLKKHTEKILTKDYCLFENGGYKLSSTSNMTWLSKIYIAQYIHENIFNIDKDILSLADKAHVEWLTDEQLSYWSWSDQILSYKIKGSKFYPRGVTSILWTK